MIPTHLVKCMYRHFQDCECSTSPPRWGGEPISLISLKTKVFNSKLKKKKKKLLAWATILPTYHGNVGHVCSQLHTEAIGKTNGLVLHNTIKQYLLYICTQRHFYTSHCQKLIILMQVTALKEQFPHQHSFHHTPQSSLCPPWPSPVPHETQHHST